MAALSPGLRSGQVPAQQGHHLAGRAMASEPFAHHGCGEPHHRHPPVQSLHPGERRGVPGPARGETLAEALQGLIKVQPLLGGVVGRRILGGELAGG
jgi:hypothetical protein